MKKFLRILFISIAGNDYFSNPRSKPINKSDPALTLPLPLPLPVTLPLPARKKNYQLMTLPRHEIKEIQHRNRYHAEAA